MIARILRFFIGILLIPMTWAATKTLISLIISLQPSSTAMVSPPILALAGGFLIWLLIYFTLPRPARTYVLAHELTHALWGSMMGAKIFRMRISKESGSVTLSKCRYPVMLMVTLAPYFFPLYTVLVIIGYYILSIFFDVENYYLYWLGMIGLTWGFHFTFTLSTLMQKQSDIQEHGHVFSYTIIYLFNVIGIALWIVIVSSAVLEKMVNFMITYTNDAYIQLWILISSKITQ